MGYYLTNGIPLWGEHRILLTEASFQHYRNKDGIVESPTKISSVATILFYCCVFVSLENVIFHAMLSLKDLEPLLEDPHNRAVLARNALRAICTGAVSWLGFKYRHVFWSELVENKTTKTRTGEGNFWMSPNGFERRLFAYRPGGHRCALLFCAYQIKNTLDGWLVHGEGPVFLLHHVVSVFQSWICAHPGGGHFYVVASAVTEVPAMISSVYACFDGAGGGVPGLGEAWPATKNALGIASGLAFLAYRVVFWFYVFAEYVADLQRAFASERSACRKRRLWIPVYAGNAMILFGIQLLIVNMIVQKANKLSQ